MYPGQIVRESVRVLHLVRRQERRAADLDMSLNVNCGRPPLPGTFGIPGKPPGKFSNSSLVLSALICCRCELTRL